MKEHILFKVGGLNVDTTVEEFLGLNFQFHFSTFYNKNRFSVLSGLCDKYGSDKGELCSGGHPYPWASHTYADFVERLFGHCRNEVRYVFECGLGTNDPNLVSSMGIHGKPGASLRVWRDYFPSAQIIGADIDKKILFDDERINTFYCDQTDLRSVAELWRQVKVDKFDLMIDDGLHTFEAGKTLLEGSFHKLRSGGIYIIEDVALSSLVDFKKYFDQKEYVYEFVTLYRPEVPLGDNSLVVIRK